LDEGFFSTLGVSTLAVVFSFISLLLSVVLTATASTTLRFVPPTFGSGSSGALDVWVSVTGAFASLVLLFRLEAIGSTRVEFFLFREEVEAEAEAALGFFGASEKVEEDTFFFFAVDLVVPATAAGGDMVNRKIK
jgi:hypothetical protein